MLSDDLMEGRHVDRFAKGLAALGKPDAVRLVVELVKAAHPLERQSLIGLLSMSSTGLSDLIDTMENAGIVRRERVGRQVLVHLRFEMVFVLGGMLVKLAQRYETRGETQVGQRPSTGDASAPSPPRSKPRRHKYSE